MVKWIRERTVTTMIDFLYHLPETVWKTAKMVVCLAFMYVVIANVLLPGFARMFGF